MAAFTLCLAEEERLAEVVKSFPCLYDKTKKGYKEKDAVSNAWNSVADNLDFINDGMYIFYSLLPYYCLTKLSRCIYQFFYKPDVSTFFQEKEP